MRGRPCSAHGAQGVAVNEGGGRTRIQEGCTVVAGGGETGVNTHSGRLRGVIYCDDAVDQAWSMFRKDLLVLVIMQL